MSYDNTNTGVLFKNKKKAKATHPDYTGSYECQCGCQVWMSGWIKESGPNSRNPGEKFLSLAGTPKTETKPTPPSTKRVLNEDGDGFDDIPF